MVFKAEVNKLTISNNRQLLHSQFTSNLVELVYSFILEKEWIQIRRLQERLSLWGNTWPIMKIYSKICGFKLIFFSSRWSCCLWYIHHIHFRFILKYMYHSNILGRDYLYPWLPFQSLLFTPVDSSNLDTSLALFFFTKIAVFVAPYYS